MIETIGGQREPKVSGLRQMEKDALDKLTLNREQGPSRSAGGKRGAISMPPFRAPAPSAVGRTSRWGVILAGGDGTRLRPLTRMISGDERPKQFCPLLGERTLLEQTLRRSELNIPPEQLIVSLTSPHAKWYSQQVGLNPSQCVIQPANKGTAPPILHALLSLSRLDADALVAILPCDHHYADEQLFSLVLESAFDIAAKRDDSVVLLGAKPDYPEVEYGWIELDSPLQHEEADLFRVRAFREKPPVEVARTLLERGSVWNTFVMVGHVHAFLDMVRAAVPELLTSLQRARLWVREETHIAASVYEEVPSVCFSHCVLSLETRRLAVLRLNNVGWSDLGDPGRAALAVRNSGCKPAWIDKWKFPMGVVVPCEEAAVATA